jgi:hypothetical protein
MMVLKKEGRHGINTDVKLPERRQRGTAYPEALTG